MAGGADENAAPTVELQLIDFGRSVDLELLPPGALLQVGRSWWWLGIQIAFWSSAED